MGILEAVFDFAKDTAISYAIDKLIFICRFYYIRFWQQHYTGWLYAKS